MPEEKAHVNAGVIGQVDSESTTTGRLIDKCGGIDERAIVKFEKESRQLVNGSFKYAWVLDNPKAERERGITIDISLWKFETSKCHFTTINALGHHGFIKNMNTLTSRRMLVSLLLRLSGEFEAGVSNNGQTRENMPLSYSLVSIGRLLPSTRWTRRRSISKKRPNEIKTETGNFLKRTVFNPDNIQLIPISGFNGDNTIESPKNTPCTRPDAP